MRTVVLGAYRARPGPTAVPAGMAVAVPGPLAASDSVAPSAMVSAPGR